MIKTYTDCSIELKTKKMRDLLFGVKACSDEDIIQHKWQVIAAWMGHSSIEQTASFTFMFLIYWPSIKIYNSPCIISNKVIRAVFGLVDLGAEHIDLNRYIQQQKWFDFIILEHSLLWRLTDKK